MDSMIHWLEEHCRAAPLTEKWLLAEDMRIAQQWKDRLNLAGCATMNLHSRTLANLTASLASFPLAEQQFKFAGHGTSQILIQTALCQLQADGRLKYFQSVRSVAALSRLMAASIRDLRLAHLDTEGWAEDAFESSDKAADLLLVYRAYRSLLTQHGLVDYADCIRLVVTGIDDGSIKLPSKLCVLMPERLDCLPVERRLLLALEDHATVEHCEGIDPTIDTTNRLTELVAGGRGEFSYNSGFGEANEVRGVFQDILSADHAVPRRLDQVEILHTDEQLYVPLILEQIAAWMSDQGENASRIPRLDELPVTFSEGLACVNTRPARALRGWLRWSQDDCSQTRVVRLIREGVLRHADPAAEMAYSTIAHVLRKLPIGFDADRYLPQIDHAIGAVNTQLTASKQGSGSKEGQGDASRDQFKLRGLQAVRSMVEPLVRLAPRDDDNGIDVLQKAKRFLTQCSRVETKLDRAGHATLMDGIDAMLDQLRYGPKTDFDPLVWLQELPLVSRIFASGPQPGRVHVAPLSRGGHSGRREVYVLGLDDGKFPRRIPVDPIVLDAERRRLSDDLKTSEERSDRAGQALDRALLRVLAEPGGRVHLSCSMRDLVDDRPQFPGPSMLDLFRITEENEKAHLDDLLKHLESSTSFVSLNPSQHLSETDAQLATMLSGLAPDAKEAWLNETFEYRANQQRAIAAATSPAFTAYDGLVPEAGCDLDPTDNHVVSPSRLETFGACPRRFFFGSGLKVRAPDEYGVDTEQWLDALQLGTLVHALFEEFLRDLTTRDETPQVKRDRDPLLNQLELRMDEWKKVVPIPNVDSFRRTRTRLRETCEIFLDKEEEYCREFNARPWVLEASIGISGEATHELASPDPVPLSLTDGRILQVRGILDRIDRLMTDGSETYAIWDYKSGSSFGFSKDEPFKQGRKLQPYLYLGMLRHRIKQCGGDEHAVTSFGYFFPSPQTDGLRLQWTHAELASGDDVLRWISDLIGDGAFIATTDPVDCNFCDYQPVCGDPEVVTSISSFKSGQDRNVVLDPWRRLRNLATEGGER